MSSPRVFRALIVDDERLSRKELRSMLGEYSNIAIVGEAEDVPAAAKAIHELKPDVIFLDIQMPGESGFDLLEKIKINCRIIFVTAFDEYAIRAFEVNAQDYLLKPVNPERLATAIKRLETNGREDRKKEAQLNTDDCVFLELNSRFHFVRIDSILRISSAGDYSEIVTKEGKKGLVSKSLKEWEQRLPENMFVRIHRTSIVNLTMVDRIEDWFNYSYRVYLKGLDKPVVMSRRYAAKIKNRLK